jgi:hypothetical protein
MGRKFPRQRTARLVSIVFGGRKIACEMSDISTGGAKLRLPYSEWLPPQFELEDASGIRRHVVIAWQGAEYLGVRFTDEGPPPRPVAQFGRRGQKQAR